MQISPFWFKKLPYGEMNKAKGSAGGGLNLKLKFVCAQCWRGGLTNEPDEALQYCSAKARHTWVIDAVRRLRFAHTTRLQTTGGPLGLRFARPLLTFALCYSCLLTVTLRWTRDRWLLLVRSSEKSRWVPVRPIPHSKNFPLHYDVGLASSNSGPRAEFGPQYHYIWSARQQKSHC